MNIFFFYYYNVVAIPTYFIKGKKEFKEETTQLIESNGGELCNNVICLGHHGVYNTSQEIKIIYLGGINSKFNKNTEEVYIHIHMLIIFLIFIYY